MSELVKRESRDVILANNTFGWSEDIVSLEDKLKVIASFVTSTVTTIDEARDTIYNLRDRLERIAVLAVNPPADVLEQILAIVNETPTRKAER